MGEEQNGASVSIVVGCRLINLNGCVEAICGRPTVRWWGSPLRISRVAAPRMSLFGAFAVVPKPDSCDGFAPVG